MQTTKKLRLDAEHMANIPRRSRDLKVIASFNFFLNLNFSWQRKPNGNVCHTQPRGRKDPCAKIPGRKAPKVHGQTPLTIGSRK